MLTYIIWFFHRTDDVPTYLECYHYHVSEAERADLFECFYSKSVFYWGHRSSLEAAQVNLNHVGFLKSENIFITNIGA